MVTVEQKRQILNRLSKGKKYRDLFVDSELTVGLAMQIRKLRIARGWTQEQLAAATGKKQSVISQVESTDYGHMSINTLKRIAAAFDVGLKIEFTDYQNMISKSYG